MTKKARTKKSAKSVIEAAPVRVEAAPAVAAPDPDRIARRAYQLWLSRGGVMGNPLEDWLRAEAELR